MFYWRTVDERKAELLRKLLDMLSKELQALIEDGSNFSLTANVSPQREDASLKVEKTIKLN